MNTRDCCIHVRAFLQTVILTRFLYHVALECACSVMAMECPDLDIIRQFAL